MCKLVLVDVTDENLDKERFSDTESEHEDDEDIRFKVFDKKKFKREKSFIKEK